jgi:hypothetical protein
MDDKVLNDIEIIRAVRCLCLEHKFDEALNLSKKVQDTSTRDTLLLICKSFKQTRINVKAA